MYLFDFVRITLPLVYG